MLRIMRNKWHLQELNKSIPEIRNSQWIVLMEKESVQQKSVLLSCEGIDPGE